MQEADYLPVYEVEELSIEQAILLMASEEEKEQASYEKCTERLLQLVA